MEFDRLFSCDKNWDDLERTNRDDVRRCDSCRKHVFYGTCERDWITSSVLGRCVVAEFDLVRFVGGLNYVPANHGGVPLQPTFRTAIRCNTPVTDDRRDILRQWVPAIFDGAEREQQILEGRPVLQRELTRDVIDSIRAELAACAPELELIELPVDGKAQLGLML